jgi:manganese transport protein
MVVTELPQAQATLKPLLGTAAALIFAVALLFSGFSSSLTAGMAGASIFAGIFQEPLDLKDRHSRAGLFLALLGGLLVIFFLPDPFQGLLWSQIVLSIQLPLTVVPLVLLTSSPKVMGKYANTAGTKILLWSVSTIIFFLNAMLLIQIF